jgi:predicted Zn-dependent protease
MLDYFYALADEVEALSRGAEVVTCSFAAEESDFVRFNRGAVRQAGSVTQRALTVDLIEGARHASGTLSLAGVPEADRARLSALVEHLREARQQLPEDPFLLYNTSPRSTERRRRNELPEVGQVLDEIHRAGRGRDVVGVYAGGAIHAGFASSLGQRNWYESFSFNLDWSFHHAADRAVKASYAGLRWRSEDLERRIESAAEQVSALARPALSIRPGRYRVYLAPAALYEIVGLLGWGGFGLRAHRTKTTPLLRMIEEGATLHPSVRIVENTRDGIAPDFQEAGFLRPERVTLIESGRCRDCLVSPRSAREYGARTNGASASETPQSVDVGGGEIAIGSVLRELGTGVYAGNLWYLNFSDRSACRMTGMTRFATFWVERGAIRAPLRAMRFDETVYRMLGENLVGLTAEREMILDPGTYFQRSVESARLPGALVDDVTFTL